MKKLLSLVLCVAISLSTLVIPASVFADGEVPTVSVVDPAMHYQELPSGTADSEISDASVTKKYKSNTYYSSGKELYTVIRNNLLARKTSFNVRYISKGTKYSTSRAFETLLMEFYYYSTDDELSTSSFDGDYLRYNVQLIGFDGGKEDTAKDGYYFYTMKVIAEYYNTAAQETAVDNAINSVVSSVASKSMSQYEALKYIHDYIANKCTYDYSAMGKNSKGETVAKHPTSFTPYGALIGGKAVCQGYATAFYRICKELGYSVRVASSDPNVGCHAWNLVKLDNSYYYVDCTWDDEARDTKSGDDYYYFLVNESTIQSEDNNWEHELYAMQFDNSYFNNKYRKYISKKNYDRNDSSLLSKCHIEFSVLNHIYSGSAKTPTVTVTNSNGKALEAGKDYTLSFSNNINTGNAYAIIYPSGEYSGLSFRQFFILPEKAGAVSVSSIQAASALAKWSVSKGCVTGYSVERVKDGKWITVANTTGSSYTLSSLASSANQYVRVRAYKQVGKRKLYGAYSNSCFFSTKPQKVTISSLKAGSKKMTVKWKSAARVTKYELQYSKRSDMKNAKTLTLSSKTLKKTIKKLSKGKKYYVRIRAYRKYTDPSKKVKYAYGSWSAKKSVKIK